MPTEQGCRTLSAIRAVGSWRSVSLGQRGQISAVLDGVTRVAPLDDAGRLAGSMRGSTVHSMIEEIGPHLFIQRHPLRMAGCQMGRIVTIVQLDSGKLFVHSTANFSQEDINEINTLGTPAWLVEATCFHDTCSKAGRTAFPEIPYLVPPGFADAESLDASPLLHGQTWANELQAIEIGGMPKIREFAFYHSPSKTLILADLLFNLPPDVGRWTQWFLRATGGIHEFPGMSRLFRFFIKDRAAFASSIQQIADLPIDRIVVAHGEPIVQDAKATLMNTLTKHGLAP